jgi:hypothetical protein
MTAPNILNYIYDVQCDTSTLSGFFEQLVLQLLNWTKLKHTVDGNFIAPNSKRGKVFNKLWPIRIIWHYRNIDGSISKTQTNKLTYDFYILPFLQIPIGGLRKDYLDIDKNGNITAKGTILYGLFSFNFKLTK